MKKLKLFFTIFTIAALLLSFVACSSPSGDGSGSDNKGDVTNNPEEDLGRELTLTFDEKIEYSSGVFYYAEDPELEDVKWYITFNNDYVVFGAKAGMNYDFYRGSYTRDDNSITISKTHHGDPSAHGPWKEETVKPNWKTGSFVNDTIVLKFYTSELDYNKATQQTWLSEPRLKRNTKSPEQNQNDNSNESGEVEEPIDNENEDNPEAGTGTQTDTENSKEDLSFIEPLFPEADTTITVFPLSNKIPDGKWKYQELKTGNKGQNVVYYELTISENCNNLVITKGLSYYEGYVRSAPQEELEKVASSMKSFIGMMFTKTNAEKTKYYDGQNAATRLLKVGDVPVTEM